VKQYKNKKKEKKKHYDFENGMENRGKKEWWEACRSRKGVARLWWIGASQILFRQKAENEKQNGCVVDEIKCVGAQIEHHPRLFFVKNKDGLENVRQDSKHVVRGPNSKNAVADRVPVATFLGGLFNDNGNHERGNDTDSNVMHGEIHDH